jgi:allophanate hydrolase
VTAVVCPPDPRLIGRWRRTLLVGPDGHCDVTSTVLWLQARSLFVDLRLPRAARPASAEGFAGRLRADGRYTCWDRLIDLHPDGAPDEGLLELTGTALLETGRHVRYVEHWERDDGAGPPGAPAPSCAVELREVATGAPAMLVQVGDDVGWARTLPGFDTEVALGIRMDDGVTLCASNLPGRAGNHLELGTDGGSLLTVDRAPDGGAIRHRWQVVALEGRFEDLPVHRAPLPVRR